MATAASVVRAVQSSARLPRQRASWADNSITIVMGLWLMIGLFIDGWAHNTRPILESFFTPWHAVLYSGFGASALWIGWLVLRNLRSGRVGLAAIPQGYDLGIVGVLLFGASGFGDMLWHIVFGIEMNLEALLSPTHLGLFVGGVLVLTSPFRAAWSSPDPRDDAPTLRMFLPTLMSLALAVSFVTFMNMYLWSFYAEQHLQTFSEYMIQRYPTAVRPLTGFSQRGGLSGVLITNLLLLAPVLLLLRRWRIPFGSITVLLTVNMLLMGALPAYPTIDPILIGLAIGLITDGLIQRLKPWQGRVWAFRTIAFAVPLLLWTTHFVTSQLHWGLAWSLELTAGVTIMAALSGLGLSLLMLPPAMPRHVS